MWAEVDFIDWAALRHNYGSAADVPGLLRRCAGPDPEDAERLPQDGRTDIAAVLRHTGRDCLRPLRTLGLT